MSATEDARGTAGRATVTPGNPGTLVGTQDVGGQPYARYRANPGTWVSASLKEQGYGPSAGYGAYAGLARSPDGTPLRNPDRIAPGQEYLVPLRAPAAAPRPAANANAPANANAATEAARGTAGRYGPPPAARPGPSSPPAGASPAAAAPMLALPAARIAPGAARTTVTVLEEAAARWGGAEVIAGEGAAAEGGAGAAAGGAAAEGVALGWWLFPVAAWGFAGYELFRLYNEVKSAERAERDSEELRRQLRQAVQANWQNGVITDDEYFLYLATGVLVVQPREGGAPAAAASASKDSKEADRLWFKVMIDGINYNKAHAFDYPFREVYVERYDGKPGYFRVDFFSPGKEIVSQKFTQLADVQEETAIRYLQELAKKYAPGTKIAPVLSNKDGVLKITKVLTGELILQVPVQRHPVPQRIIKEAILLKITIRDDFGRKLTVIKNGGKSKATKK